MIMFVNWAARSTFDISRKPTWTAPRPFVPGFPVVAGPELLLTENRLLPVRVRPDGFEKLANVRIGPAVTVEPTVHDTCPFWAMVKLVAPAGTVTAGTTVMPVAAWISLPVLSIVKLPSRV